MKKIKAIICISVLFFSASCSESEQTEENVGTDNTTTEQVEEIVESELEPAVILDLENEEFANKLNEVNGLLIDVRTPEEFAEGHIDGAINLDYNSGAFESYVDSLEVTEPVFVYCQAGGRSGKARDILKNRDFIEVYNLKNGYGNWDK